MARNNDRKKFDEIASKWHFRNMMTEAVKKIYITAWYLENYH